MTFKPYMHDCYAKEFTTKIISVTDGKFVVLEESYFYPTSGGQPHDTGVMETSDGRKATVIFVGLFDGKVSHQIEEEGLLKEGDEVRCKIDWDRRYRLMRMHTAAHIVSKLFEDKKGAIVTGNQLGLEKSRIDYQLDDYDKEELQSFEGLANEYIEADLPVTSHFLSREEAEQRLSRLSTLKKGFPEHIKEVRLLEIGEIDCQACGGTHVKHVSEIKGVKFLKFDNKGKNNRRLYFTLVD